MTFDLNAVDPAYRAEIRGSVIGNLESDFLKVFTPQDVNNIAGTVPYIPSKYAFRLAGRSSKVQLTAAPKPQLGSLAGATFRFNEKFATRFELPKHVAEGLNQINSAERLLAYLHERNRAQIAGDVDADGATFLKAIAQTSAATAVFSNTSTARFIKDMDKLADLVPKFNFIVIGESEAREICQLPFLTTSTGNFSGAEMTSSYDDLNVWLRRRYKSLTDVWIAGNYYNSGNEGTALAIGKDYDGVFAIGDKEAVIPCGWPAMEEFTADYIPGAQVYYEEMVFWMTIATGDASRLARLTDF